MAAVFEDELIYHTLRLEAVAAGGRMRELIVLRALASAEGAPGADAAANVQARLEGQVDALLEQARSATGADPLGIMNEWRPPPGEGDGGENG
ncbi:MAG: hypothetical protein KGL53_03520 [Elusimicrobia bacterium]|nr:hypothetical protein [Elusimicrobiota bacterium]